MQIGHVCKPATKVPGFRFDGSGRSFQTASVEVGVKEGGMARFGSKSNARKAASAMIAKIPEPLARHIARTYYPARGTMSDAEFLTKMESLYPDHVHRGKLRIRLPGHREEWEHRKEATA
jgi:hypothetical protein